MRDHNEFYRAARAAGLDAHKKIKHIVLIEWTAGTATIEFRNSGSIAITVIADDSELAKALIAQDKALL